MIANRSLLGSSALRGKHALAVGLIAASLAGMAWAQASSNPASAAPMSFGALADKLGSQGFTDIREIERKSDKLFEVKARDAQGRWMELYVDARSGEILKAERDRKGYRY